MNDREKMDLRMMVASMRTLATKLERAVAVIEAAEAAEALVTRCSKLLPSDAARPQPGGVMQGAVIPPTDRASMSAGKQVTRSIPELEASAFAVFDHTLVDQMKSVKKSKVVQRPPF